MEQASCFVGSEEAFIAEHVYEVGKTFFCHGRQHIVDDVVYIFGLATSIFTTNSMCTEEVGNDLDRSSLLYATNNTQHLQLVFKIQAVAALYFHRTRTFANNFVYSLHCLFVEFVFRKFVQAVGRIEDTATTLCNFCIA